MSVIIKRGIVIIAIGDQYCEMALNLCLSIRANNSSEIDIMLLHTGMPPEVADRSSFFTHIIDVTDKVKDYHVNLHRAMYAKLLAYELSPFDETILLDADTLLLPGKTASSLFHKCTSDFMAMTTGFYERGGAIVNKYTWWTKGDNPGDAMAHYMVPQNNRLPQINASFIFFRKSGDAQRVFAAAKRVWSDKTFTGYVEHHRSKTEEFCFNIACAKENVYPAGEGKTFHPVFIKMHHSNWQEETIQHQYSAFSLAGSELGNENDHRLARLYNRLTAFYRRHFGIGADFLLTDQSKNRKAPATVKVVGYWHVYAANNWIDIVTEQLNIIRTSGLYQRSDAIKVSFIGSKSELADFTALIQSYDKVGVYYHTTAKGVFEFPALDILKVDADNAQTEFYGYYFHTKGVSKPSDTCKNWRDYLNHYNLRLWNKSIDALNAGYELTGCNWLRAQKSWEDHFSGNFFWFRTNYIKLLPSIYTLKRDNRYEAEMWVGKANAKVHELSRKEVNLPGGRKWFPRRKIGVFVSGNLKNSSTITALNALAMTGLLEDSAFSVGCFSPKETIDDIIPTHSHFTRTEDYATPETAKQKAHSAMVEWCDSNPGGVAILLNVCKDDVLADTVIRALVEEWKNCYHLLTEGYSSAGIVVKKGEWIGFASDSFWINAESIRDVVSTGRVLTILKENYYRLPVIVNISDAG